MAVIQLDPAPAQVRERPSARPSAPDSAVPRRRPEHRPPVGHDPSVAPLWRRLVARGIDMGAVFGWMWMLGIVHVLFHLPLWSDRISPDPWGRGFLAVVTYVVFLGAYEIAFTAHDGATLGKEIMGLRVVRDGTDLTPTVGQAARRFLLPGTAQLLPGVWLGLGLAAGWGATALVDDRRRTVHDRLAGTQVVMADHRPEPVAPVQHFPTGTEVRDLFRRP